MPTDRYSDGDDELEKEQGRSGAATRFKEFDCPDCNANNPVDEPFGGGDEVLCNYCGTQFSVKVTDEGKLRLREI